MSLAIVNPFNQIIQFTKGFYPQNDFSKEFLNSIGNFVLNNNYKSCKISDSEIFYEKLENLILNRFDFQLIEIINENIDTFLIEFISTFYSITENEINIGTELQNYFIEYVKKEFKIIPYVSEKFIPFLLSLNQYFELKLVFQSKLDKSIFNFLLLLLDLNTIQSFAKKFNNGNYLKVESLTFNDSLFISFLKLAENKVNLEEYDSHERFIEDLSKQIIDCPKCSILIFEEAETFLNLGSLFEKIQFNLQKKEIKKSFFEIVFPVFNTLLFSSKQKLYTDYKNFNLKEIIKNAINPCLIIESLMQVNLFIEYVLKKSYEFDKNLSPSERCLIDLAKSIRKTFFNDNQKKVLYFFNEDNSAKSYRKRLLAITTENIKYIPFITREDIEYEFYNKLYGRIDVLLQRAPYFYLESEEKKNLCMKLEEYLDFQNQIVLKMSSFDIVEKLFFRSNCYSLIKDFVDNASNEIKDKFSIIVDVPFTIYFVFDRPSLDFMKRYLENSDNNEYVEKSQETLISFLQTLIGQIKEKMKAEEIDFPVLIKPDECEVHEMFLILSESGLNHFCNVVNFRKILKSRSFVIQKFINHDGLMFKNFFINKNSYTFMRPSLPNLEGKNLKLDHYKNDCFKFKNEFLYNKEDETFWTNIENPNEKLTLEEVNYELIDFISKLFAKYTNVNLFGLDYLFDKNTNTYYILECNYFPSYRELKDKLQPEFESHIITYHNELLK